MTYIIIIDIFINTMKVIIIIIATLHLSSLSLSLHISLHFSVAYTIYISNHEVFSHLNMKKMRHVDAELLMLHFLFKKIKN